MKQKRALKTPKFWLSLLGTLLIIAGVSLALSPFLTNIYSVHFSSAAVDAEELEETPFMLEGKAAERILKEGSPKAVPAGDKTGEETREEYTEREAVPLEPLEGTLVIPSLDIRVKVGYGVELEDLRISPGFYPQGEHPAYGNTSIAGHRTTYGAWFRHLDKLEQGEEIFLYYDGAIYPYQVDKVFEVHDRDWSVIDPTQRPALTLTTCHPPGWATHRLIVRAYLVN